MLRKIRRAWEHQPHDIRGPSDDWVRRGLVALFDTRNAIEVMAGNRASAISSSLMGSTGGLAADFSGTANQQYAHRAAYALTGAGSILILCDIDALSSYGALIGKQSATTLNVPYELRLGSAATDSRVNLVRADGSGYTTSVMSGSNLISAGAKLAAIVLSMDSGERGPGGSIWVNGTKTTYASSTSGTPATDNSANVWIGRRFDGATQLDGRIYHIGLLNRAATDEDAAEFAARPFSLFEPRRIWVPVSAGGSTYPVSLTETTTTTDAATAAYIASASVSESITAADSLAAATTWVRSLTEAATAAESITTAGTFAASITEAASTADALTSAVTWARALTEAASASDLATAVIHAVAALTEAATAADSQATGSIYTGSVNEAASAADALTAAATLVALLTEVTTTSDAATSAATWVRLLTEPATAVDSVAGALPATYTVSITEVLAATELLAAVLAAQGVISAPPLGHGFGMSRRVIQAGRSRPANLNSRTR